MAAKTGITKRCWSFVFAIGLCCYSAWGQVGVWTRCNVPITVDPNYPNGAGAQSVVADPARQSDIYAFVSPNNSQKMVVLKSTDYGVTWADVNETVEMHGNPWGAAIDPNPNRDAATPPTLYTPAGYGAGGMWKSIDGGKNWAQMAPSATSPIKFEPYSVSILPDNLPNHILITCHYTFPNMSEGGFGESTDGGVTWFVHNPPSGIGTSHYFMIVDKDTWLSISQDNGGANGIWKTSTAGRVNGAISTAAWRKVDNHEHQHGSFSTYTDPLTRAIYAPGMNGIRRTTDGGETWSWAYQVPETNVGATANYIYASQLNGPRLVRAPRNAPTQWQSYTTAPSDMKGGAAPLGTATTFDGANWIVLMGCDSEGLWRYVEPETPSEIVHAKSSVINLNRPAFVSRKTLSFPAVSMSVIQGNEVFDVKGQKITISQMRR